MDVPKSDSKYFGLYQFLRRCRTVSLRLSFYEIESHLKEPLPASARTSAFWSNRSQGALQAAAWMQAGYRVASVDVRAGVVVFERLTRTYHIRREGGVVVWESQLIRELRRHLGVNQAGLADLLGVRQQTVSEWETGMYAPTRSRSKHLTLIAERAGFPYVSEAKRERERKL